MVNWRYILSAALVTAAVALVFLAFTPSRAMVEQRIAARRAAVNWQVAADDPTEMLALRWGFMTKPLEDSWPRRRFEEAFNVRLTPYQIGEGEALETKLPLRLAAGDVPDVFRASGSQLATFARHGFLMPLPRELLLEHAPHAVNLTRRFAPEVWTLTSCEGVNFGVPTIWYDGLYPRAPVWRLDWLRNVGITTVPQTLNEMEEALRRFRYNDPDGNGQQDTYGMSGDLIAWYTTFSEIFGAFGVLPFDWMRRDGRIVWGGVLPETRDALELLSRWYREGLIHPDFVTDQWYGSGSRKFYSGKIGYHNYLASYEAFDESNPQSMVVLMRQLQANADVTPGQPPLGPAGHRGMRVWGAGNAAPVVFGAHMASRPEAVVRVLQALDRTLADLQLYLELHIGQEGRHWRWSAPETGSHREVEMIPPWDEPEAMQEQGLVPPMFLAGSAVFAPLGGGPEHFGRHLPPALLRFRQQYRKTEWGMTDVFGRPQNVPGAEADVASLIQLQQTAFAKIIRGQEPLSSFDTFVRQWHSQGGDRALKLASDYARQLQDILREVGGP